MPIQAIIFVPHCADAARWIDHCFVHCLARGYIPKQVVRDWRDVIGLLAGGLRAVVVVGRRDQIPGIEVVTEQGPRDDPALRRPGQRSEVRQPPPATGQ